MGVVHGVDLHKNILGTVTLRDFCNREEIKIPSYLDVISVIDHHKSSLNTSSPPMAIIADASRPTYSGRWPWRFAINDNYGLCGQTAKG